MTDRGGPAVTARGGPAAEYDVAVVGGGLIGAAAALGAARLGRRVVLLEPFQPELQRGGLGVDVRNVAVSPASQALLERLDVWSRMDGAAYRRMEVWEERGTRAMIFDAAEVNRTELGWIVENSVATVALWEALRRHEGVTIHPARVVGVVPRETGVNLELEEGAVRARLLLAADGARSPLRAALGVAVETFDTGHAALATVVRTRQPHDGVAYQRFLLEGPVALLPTREPRLSSVVWSQPPEQAARRRDLPEAEFCAELARCLQHRLGTVEAVDERLVFPLQQLLASTFTPHPRVLLVGDAARVLHPLAGLGANMGFEDVRALLAVLHALPAGADPGTPGLWRAYDRRRRARARLMLGVMSGLRRVYARGDPASQLLRNAGVALLGRLVPVKRQVMMEAMGLGAVAEGTAR